MQLSYSSSKDLASCESKYCHRKIWKTPVDTDVTPDTFAFRFGKAFHLIHEYCQHELGYFEDRMMEYLHEAMKAENLDDDKDTACHLASAVVSSLTLWAKTGLRVIKCELKIESPYLLGYVDFIAVDPTTRRWWIGDLKTTSMGKNDLGKRLIRDPQLSLYSEFVAFIAQELDLNPDDFLGCLYRETVKSKIVVRANEKPAAFVKRSIAESRIFVIPRQLMDRSAVAVHSMLHKRAMELEAGATPLRNLHSCLDYNRSCDYFSHCYGRNASYLTEHMRDLTMSLSRTKDSFEICADSLQEFSYGEQQQQQQQQPIVELDW